MYFNLNQIERKLNPKKVSLFNVSAAGGLLVNCSMPIAFYCYHCMVKVCSMCRSAAIEYNEGFTLHYKEL